jgi:N6-adenosine-specific RNA methylase IME4
VPLIGWLRYWSRLAVTKKYSTIYADPPWNEQGGGKIKRGADRHYLLMKTRDIIALPVSDVAAANAHLYLWATNNFLPDALAVMEAWGFAYKTTITWAKDRFGLGQYFRGQTEHCLFGVRGMLPYKVANGKRAQGRTLFTARVTEHSAKPDEMRKMIEQVSYTPRLELFARKRSIGWDVWGNEVESDLQLLSAMGAPDRASRGRGDIK